jgi:hypothetical protein
MKKVLPLLMISLPLLAQEDDWSLNYRFTVTGDYLHYRRSLAHKKNFVYNTDVITGADRCGRCEFKEPCRSGHLVKNFEFEMGYRVAASFTTHRSVWEGVYLHMVDWESSCKSNGEGALNFSLKNPDLFNDYTDADHAHIHYRAGFESAEFNYFRFMSSKKDDYFSVAWLLGLRYLHIPEWLQISYTKGENKSDDHIDVNNYIGALQGGTSVQWNPTKALSWDFMVKVGGGYDWGRQKTHFRDFNNTVDLSNFEVSDYSWPLIVDLTMTLGWQAFKWLNFHVGYQMIYLNGFAAATDQVMKNPNHHHEVKMTGAAIYYGLLGGLTLSF